MQFLIDVLVKVTLTVALVGAYTMFALGIVFIYRGSRVLNLCHGAMAMIPAFVTFSLTPKIGLPLSIIIALALGGLLGVAVELGVVRRLRGFSATAQTVGTVAVLGLLIAFAVAIWGTTPVRGPNVFPEKIFPIGNSSISVGEIGLFVTAIVVALGFIALFKYTHLGLSLRAAADNRRAAALMGINPDRTTLIAWLFAGLLAALGGVLLGATSSFTPYTLPLSVLPAFVAALIGGLENIRGALLGSAVVGLTVGIVPNLGGFGQQVGAPQLGLAILAFIVMSLRGQKFSATDVRSGL